jgi:hypothetical protein
MTICHDVTVVWGYGRGMPLKDPAARKAYQAAYRAADLGRRAALVAARREVRQAEALETYLAILRESRR